MEQESLVEVICDTSFLIHFATKKIRNIDTLGTEIGKLSFAVPLVVLNELQRLQTISKKKHDAAVTLDFIQSFRLVPITGNFADKELINYVKKNNSIIGTMDKNLKKNIKENGGSVLSFSNDRIVLES